MLTALTSFLAIVAGAFVFYVYNRDFGVDYQGRARLNYNWEYYRTTCPEEDYNYDGKYCAFSYPKFQDKNPLREAGGEKDGAILDGYLLHVRWRGGANEDLKAELTKYLSSSQEQSIATPSVNFMRWLVGSGPRVATHMKKVLLKGGKEAILLSGAGGELDHRPGLIADLGHKNFYIVGFGPGDILLKAEILAPMDLPEEQYREMVFGPQYSCTRSPSAERDAKIACVLEKFINTFEIKKS